MLVTQIEFVCVNSTFDDATSVLLQSVLFDKLRTVPGLLVYRENFSCYCEGTQTAMVAVIKPFAPPRTLKKVLAVAKTVGVSVDEISKINWQKLVYEIYGPEVARLKPMLTDLYET